MSFSRQLDEIEVIQAMFSGPDEFLLEDAGKLTEIKSLLDTSGDHDDLLAHFSPLRFTVRVPLGDESTLGFVCSLPREYPHSSPRVNISARGLPRRKCEQIEAKVRCFISLLVVSTPNWPSTQPCIHPICA